MFNIFDMINFPLLSSSIPPNKKEAFIKRREFFEEIKQKLNEKQITIISGIPGSGKSICIHEYVRKLDDKAVIVRWFNAGNYENILRGFKEIALELNTDLTNRNKFFNDIYSIIYTIKNTLKKCTKKIIFVFDNVNNYDDISFLSNLPNNIKILITTRNENLLSPNIDINYIYLKEFTLDEAREYLKFNLSLYRLLSSQNIESIISKVNLTPYILAKVSTFLKLNEYMDINEYLAKLELKDSNQAESDILFDDLLIKEDGPKAWNLLQYLSYLDPYFINIKIIKKLLSIEEDEFQNIVKILKSYSLVSIIHDQYGEIGLKLNPLIQNEVRIYAADKVHYYDQTEIKDSILETLNSIMPKIINHVDKNFFSTKLLYLHVKKVLENNINIELLSETSTFNIANLSHKLGVYYNLTLKKYDQAIIYQEKAVEIIRSLCLINEKYIIYKKDFLVALNSTYESLSGAQKAQKIHIESNADCAFNEDRIHHEKNFGSHSDGDILLDPVVKFMGHAPYSD